MKTPANLLLRFVMVAGIGMAATLTARAWPYSCHVGGYDAPYSGSSCYQSYGYEPYRSYRPNAPVYYHSPYGHSYARYGYGFDYGYGYRSGYGSYHFPDIYPYGYPQPRGDYWQNPKIYVYTTRDFGDDPEGGEKALGWKHLSAGELSEATALFAASERQYPARGWPKIGAGLIAGLKGDYGNAHYNFRRAFRFDPDGPGALPDMAEFKQRLVAFAEHYRDETSRSRKNPDAAFMLAAFSYMAGDYPTAREAIEKAIAQGDDSRAAKNLKGLVDRIGATHIAQD